MKSRAKFVQALSAVALREHPFACQAGDASSEELTLGILQGARAQLLGALLREKASGKFLLCRGRKGAVGLHRQMKLLLRMGAAVFCPGADHRAICIL